MNIVRPAAKAMGVERGSSKEDALRALNAAMIPKIYRELLARLSFPEQKALFTKAVSTLLETNLEISAQEVFEHYINLARVGNLSKPHQRLLGDLLEIAAQSGRTAMLESVYEIPALKPIVESRIEAIDVAANETLALIERLNVLATNSAEKPAEGVHARELLVKQLATDQRRVVRDEGYDLVDIQHDSRTNQVSALTVNQPTFWGYRGRDIVFDIEGIKAIQAFCTKVKSAIPEPARRATTTAQVLATS